MIADIIKNPPDRQTADGGMGNACAGALALFKFVKNIQKAVCASKGHDIIPINKDDKEALVNGVLVECFPSPIQTILSVPELHQVHRSLFYMESCKKLRGFGSRTNAGSSHHTSGSIHSF